eukprot:NODE_16_length_49026_cov_1.035992.p31 type:complete len:107 gc:universal NODE_16_length_49026_cov_1.035992:42959-43279(+)
MSMPSATYLKPFKRPVFVEESECAGTFEFYVKNCVYFIFWWFYRSIMAPYIYLRAMWADDVEWRGRSYLLLMNGKVKLKPSSIVETKKLKKPIFEKVIEAEHVQSQ